MFNILQIMNAKKQQQNNNSQSFELEKKSARGHLQIFQEEEICILYEWYAGNYCLSNKSWLILYSEFLYKLGQGFVDIQ